MDLTTLRAVLSDLRPKLLPSRFEKAQQPDSATLQLGFRTLQGMLWLELSWRADAPRWSRSRLHRGREPAAPWRNRLQHSLRQMAWWDLVQCRIRTGGGVPDGGKTRRSVQRVLVLELMGRHSNLLLLDDQRRGDHSGQAGA